MRYPLEPSTNTSAFLMSWISVFPMFFTQNRTSPSEGGATWIISMAVPIRSAMVRDDDTMDAPPVLTAGRIALTTMTAATIAAIVSSAVVRTLSNRSRVLRLGFLSRPLGLLLPQAQQGAAGDVPRPVDDGVKLQERVHQVVQREYLVVGLVR